MVDSLETPTTFDAFADAEEASIHASIDFVHIRVHQRNGKKCLTTVEGLKPENLSRGLNEDLAKLVKNAKKDKKRTTNKEITEEDLGLEKLLKELRRAFCCNGHVVADKELGKIIQLQGDHRIKVSEFLVTSNFVTKMRVKLHGV